MILGFVLGLAVGAVAAAILVKRAADEQLSKIARLFSFALHEVNTPATAVNMTVLNLLSGLFGELPPDQVKWIELARDQTGRMNAIVGELRDFVHLTLHHDLRPMLSEASPAEMVEEALKISRRGFAHSGVELTVEVEDALPTVRADADRFPRAVGSLLFHARKFRVSGPVALRVRRAGHAVAVEIEYAGAKGVDAADSLDLYFPARARKDQLLSATGVGLGLIRELARLSGGDLDFRVDPDGRSRLTLTAPEAGRA